MRPLQKLHRIKKTIDEFGINENFTIIYIVSQVKTDGGFEFSCNKIII